LLISCIEQYANRDKGTNNATYVKEIDVVHLCSVEVHMDNHWSFSMLVKNDPLHPLPK
jgi:hypothetical protein